LFKLAHTTTGPPPLAQPGLDVSVPNVARVYDVLLGGKENFPADRQTAAKLLAAVPEAAVAARENRAFLGRAVRFLYQEAGIRQFLDIGAGLPAAGSVHEMTEGAVPPARVVYADHDHRKSGCAHAHWASLSAVNQLPERI
jgi:hypothetical protein